MVILDLDLHNASTFYGQGKEMTILKGQGVPTLWKYNQGDVYIKLA